MFKDFDKYKLVYRHLWGTYGRLWTVRSGFVIRFIMRICQLIVLPVALSLIITHISRQEYDDAKHAVLVFALFSLIMGVASPLARFIGMLGENKAYRDITGNYFSKLVSADLDYFNSNLAGYLTTATRQYVDSCMILMRNLRDRYMFTLLGIIFPICVILWLDPLLGVVTLFLSGVQASYLVWSSHKLGKYRERSREVYKRNSGRMADIVSNILAVKATAQENGKVDEVRQGSIEEGKIFYIRYTMQAKLTLVREFITVGFFLALLWLTVERMSSGHINITAAVLITTYTTTIMTAIYALSEDLDEHDDLVDKILPAFDILNRRHAVTDPALPTTLSNVKGDVTFREVTFAYEKSHPRQYVFQNFNLHIPAGQKIGIVGLSGAGKSTLVKLLLRFNDVDSGSIQIDGTDIREVKQDDVRSNIAYVPQEPLLLHQSIRENVLLGRPQATDAEVFSSLTAAHASSFVNQLTDGLDSIVGERGVKLSGGQKQRIAIARAVLQGSRVMVLDEATSALDSESEQIIKDSFSTVLKGKTALVVAHRLSTLSEMDRIVVIEKGTVVEDGTHAELIGQGGLYARLWNRQQKLGEDTSID